MRALAFGFHPVTAPVSLLKLAPFLPWPPAIEKSPPA